MAWPNKMRFNEPVKNPSETFLPNAEQYTHFGFDLFGRLVQHRRYGGKGKLRIGTGEEHDVVEDFGFADRYSRNVVFVLDDETVVCVPELHEIQVKRRALNSTI